MSAHSTIYIEHTAKVTCGGCAKRWRLSWSWRGGKLVAARQLRKDGWSYAGAKGWLCPNCAPPRRKAAST